MHAMHSLSVTCVQRFTCVKQDAWAARLPCHTLHYLAVVCVMQMGISSCTILLS